MTSVAVGSSGNDVKIAGDNIISQNTKGKEIVLLLMELVQVSCAVSPCLA